MKKVTFAQINKVMLDQLSNLWIASSLRENPKHKQNIKCKNRVNKNRERMRKQSRKANRG